MLARERGRLPLKLTRKTHDSKTQYDNGTIRCDHDSLEESESGVGTAGISRTHDATTTRHVPQVAVQATARTGRYSALDAWAVQNSCAAILTAHHLDDQVRVNATFGL
jgi:tRNA(Ile)-lysidine synthase TilS/MesJ